MSHLEQLGDFWKQRYANIPISITVALVSGFLSTSVIRSLNVMTSFLFSPVGLMLCHQQLALPELFELWRQALHGSYITTLCRDEVLHTHLFIVNYFESIKG